jgi:hypothetical protein
MLTRSAISGGDNIRRKIALRILPFVFVLYIIAYLDRANVAYGTGRILHGMNL